MYHIVLNELSLSIYIYIHILYIENAYGNNIYIYIYILLSMEVCFLAAAPFRTVLYCKKTYALRIYSNLLLYIMQTYLIVLNIFNS